MKDYKDYLNKVIQEDPERRKGIEFESWLFNISLNIARLRKLKGLTQGEFAKKLGISQGAVGRIETGQNMTCSTLWKLSEVLEEPLVILGSSKENEKKQLADYLEYKKPSTVSTADAKNNQFKSFFNTNLKSDERLLTATR